MLRLALCAAALLLAGCDPADPGRGQDCATGTLTATAAGSAYAADCVVLSFSNGGASLTALTNIDGSDGSTQRQIVITIPNAAEGTYRAPFEAIPVYVDGAFDGGRQVSGTITTGTSGTVTVSSVTDSSIEGTFSFSGPETEFATSTGQPGSSTPTGRTVQVTGGSFDVRL